MADGRQVAGDGGGSATSAAPDHDDGLAQPRRFWAAFTVWLAVLLAILDSTIANVALPHMAGSLSASQDQISWVLTSYIVSAAIATPLTGWFSTRFGRKRVFLVCIVGFTVASALCGVSGSLVEINI